MSGGCRNSRNPPSESARLANGKYHRPFWEAQARDRVKERKARTRRLIQEGAILEKVLPEVRTMEPSVLEGYLSRKLGKQI